MEISTEMSNTDAGTRDRTRNFFSQKNDAVTARDLLSIKPVRNALRNEK